MAMSINELTNALRDDVYAARTDEQLQQEAEARVGASYEAMRGAAQQRQSTIDEAYARELQSLSDTLASSQQAVAQQAARGNAAIDDYVYGRNMQRTSYSAGSKGSVAGNLEKAAQLLAQRYNTASSGVENSRILLAEQLAGTLAQYDKDYLSDVQAYINDQKQLDYDRRVASEAEYNALQMQLFELGKAGSRSSGGSSRKKSSGSSSKSSSGSSLWTALKGTNVAAMSSAARKVHNAITILTGNNKNSETGKKDVSGGVKG